MNRLIKLMFERRGYELDYYDKISKCGHDIPDNIETMCDVLKRYHDLHEHITLLTDFDMDGIMSGVIGFAGLAQLGFDVSLYMPDVTGGYGFHESDIDKIMDQYPNTKAILTADVGITSYGGIDRGSQLGVEMLITDHHRPELVLKNASVVVDPKIASDNDNIFSDICGASVLYYTLYRYAEKYDAANVPQIHRLRVFAGIGTVSDNMPLIYENRGFVTDAVDICRFAYGGDDTAENVENVNSIEGCEVYRRAFLGLHVIMKAFKEIGKFGDPSTLHEDFFGFYVAPVFNSIKRLGADIRLAYNVFFGGYQAALDSMEALFKLNEERKELVNEYFSMLTTVPQPWAPYVLMTNGSGGIRGLLAMNYVNLSHLPALVVGASDNGLSGSGRSPAWYPFADRMQVANIDGLRVAGHNGAFGVFIRDEAVIDKLIAFLNKDLPKFRPEPNADGSYESYDFTISYDGTGDCDLDIGDFIDFLDELEPLRPFGPAFEPPYILLRFPSKKTAWTFMGKSNEHVKVSLPCGLKIVCFNQGDNFIPDGSNPEEGPKVDEDSLPDVIEVAGSLSYNEYKGTRSVQFMGNFLNIRG